MLSVVTSGLASTRDVAAAFGLPENTVQRLVRQWLGAVADRQGERAQPEQPADPELAADRPWHGGVAIVGVLGAAADDTNRAPAVRAGAGHGGRGRPPPPPSSRPPRLRRCRRSPMSSQSRLRVMSPWCCPSPGMWTCSLMQPAWNGGR